MSLDKMKLQESIMSDLDAMARDHSELELFIEDALSDKYFNLKNDQDTIDFLKVIFDGAHKQHDMSPMQVTEKKLMMNKESILKAIKEVLTEKKATHCGRCGHTHVKGTPCPRPFKESVNQNTIPVRVAGSKPGDRETIELLPAAKIQALKSTGKVKITPMEEDLDIGHEDNEPHMIKSELYQIAKYALQLYKMVGQFEGKGKVDFPAWWQSKITKANAMISSAKHYLEFELTEPAMDQALTEKKAETLDAVGKEDEDINNDGKVDKTDKYLKGRRVKIGQAIAKHSKK